MKDIKYTLGKLSCIVHDLELVETKENYMRVHQCKNCPYSETEMIECM